MITKFARLKFDLFTKPSKLDFLRVHQDLEGSNFNPRNTQCIPVVNPAMVGSPPLILSKIEHFETASKG